MINYLQKNIIALQKVNNHVTDILSKIEKPIRFQCAQEKSTTVETINIFDSTNNFSLHFNPLEEANKLFQRIGNLFYLYIFGIGNGALVNALLKQEKLRRLLIVEPEPELLYIALSNYDFSDALTNQKLQVLMPDQLDLYNTKNIFCFDDSVLFSNRYELIVLSNYYQNFFQNDIYRVDNLLQQAIRYMTLLQGNSFNDTLKGITQTLEHLHLLLHKPRLSNLYKKKLSSTAVLVSTGPSLDKQLPLLRAVAPYATIISVDASLPVLEKANIKPDICVSIERDEPTAQFFIQTSDDFKKDIIFVCASLQHDVTFDALKSYQVIPILRPLLENRYFDLNECGYIGAGASAANMGHDLAFYMGFDRCVLIGQDLSFSTSGATHSKGHIFETYSSIQKEIDSGKTFTITAYGGEEEVSTHIYWKHFLDAFTDAIIHSKNFMQTVNATEGGARIPQSIEASFSSVVEELKTVGVVKHTLTIDHPNQESVSKDTKNVKTKLRKLSKEGHKLLKKIAGVHTQIKDVLSCGNGFDNPKNYEKLCKTVITIDETRKGINHRKEAVDFFIPLIKPSYIEAELTLCDSLFNHYTSQTEQFYLAVKLNEPIFFMIKDGLEKILQIIDKQLNNEKL